MTGYSIVAAELLAEQNDHQAQDWKRSYSEKVDELQQVQSEVDSIMAKAEQIRRDADKNLAQGLATVKTQQEQIQAQEAKLKTLKEAIEPLLDMIPEVEGGGEATLLERIKSAPTRVGQYITEMVESIVKGVLSIIHVHLPSADMSMIHRKPRGKTEAELAADLAAAEEKVEGVAKAYAGKLKLL